MDANHLKALWPTTYRGPWMEPACQPGLASVIMPAYDRVGVIAESLDSVFAQTYRPLELVVVDDGSTDGTSALVEAWGRGDCADDEEFLLRSVRQDHSGAPAARNCGLVRCRGEFIQFLDSDDLLHPKKIEKQVARLVQDRRIDLTYARTAYFTETVDWSADPYGRFPEADERPLTAYLLGGCWPTMSALFRRRACHAVGPWDEQARVLEDWDYSIRIMLGGACLDYLDETLLLYRQDHGVRPTVTSRALSPQSLRSRCALTARWVQWIRAAGQLDPDVQRVFSSQLLELAKTCLVAGNVGLAREMLDTLESLDLAAPRSRSRPMYVCIARMPSWCGPILARGLRRSIAIKDRASSWPAFRRRREDAAADRRLP